MKLQYSNTFVAVAIAASLIVPVRAQTCTVGAVILPIEIVFESREATATLVGFTELTSPSSPPRRYRKRTVAGEMNITEYGQSGNCDAEPCAAEAHISFANASSIYGGGPFVGGGHLTVASETANDVTFVVSGVSTAEDSRPLSVMSSRLNVGGVSRGNGGTVTFAKGTMFQVFVEVNYVYWGQVGPAVCVRAGNTPVTTDTWDIEEVYDKNTGQLTQARHATNRKYLSSSASPIPGGMPVAGGRPDLLYVPRVSPVVGPVQPVYVGVGLTRLQRKTTGLECVPGLQFGPSSMRASGEVAETLSEEDTETDAEKRALLLEVAGSSNVAFRTSFAGSSFSYRKVHYKAKFDFRCPGDYIFTVHYTEKLHNSPGAGEPRVRVVQRRVEAGIQTIEGDVDVKKKDIDYTVEKVEARLAPPCKDSPPGSGDFSLGSVKAWLNLGQGTGDYSGGGLLIDSPSITERIYTPRLLLPAIPEGNGFEAIRDSGELIRQVRAPQTLVDIVVLNASSYEVRFYSPGQSGAQDPVTKIYALTGSPFVTYRFENPTAGETKRLRITEMRGSSVKITEYSFDSAASTWLLSTADGLRKESEVETTVGGDKVRTNTVRNSADQVVSQVARTYRRFVWGEELIREVLDPDGAALTTTYEFYEALPNSDPNYRRLKQRTDARGDWERLTYDGTGRVLKSVRPFLNAPPNTVTDALCRVTETVYDTIPDADGDGVAESRETTIDNMLGRETGRSYVIHWSRSVVLGLDACKSRSEIEATIAGAAWDAGTNLVTRVLTYAAGTFASRIRQSISPDGTATFTTYSTAPNGTVTSVVRAGQPNASLDDIVDGSRTVTLRSAAGQIIGESVGDIASGLEVSGWTATEFDVFGRPTRMEYNDGTLVTRSFACCGLASERDRTGLVTTYSYDPLGRRELVTRSGISTKTAYDAMGRVRSVVRIGTDGSQMPRETRAYDLAGRLMESSDALNRLTTFTESYDASTGRMTRTTTRPNGGTVIEVTARDGSQLSISGTAVAPRTFEYGVDVTGVFVKEVAVNGDSQGQLTATEWIKHYTDFAGRDFKMVFADGAVTQSFYNASGQVARRIDPDGVTVLFAYNGRGEQEMVAVDINGNQSIDLTGTDHIKKTSRTVVTKTEGAASYTVHRLVTLNWETDGLDSPVVVAIEEESSDGRRTWQTVRGVTSKSVTTLDSNGGRTITTTTPDGVKSIGVYAGDQLLSTTMRNAADERVAGTSYAYDAHGRLSVSTDARNGAATFTYYADDRTHTATSPDPDTAFSGPGYDAQTTTYIYDLAGRVSSVTQPDGGVVHYTYWPLGGVKRTWGARTFPLEYTYDFQGRVKTLTTWRDFAGDSGKAVTTWSYDPARGFLMNKRYADGTGPSYSYKPSGRMQTRSWVRLPVITTTYSYTAAGDLELTDYSDTTPDVTFAYDRSGRPKTIADGAGVRSLAYHPSAQLAGETYVSGMLAGFSVTRSFDESHRISGIAVPSVVSASYTYDSASRLDTVTSSQNSVTYGYHADSSLVRSVAFRNAGGERLVTTKNYDRLNRLRSTASAPTSGTAISTAYTYDAANQRTRGTREDNSYWSFAYDSLGQVTAGKKLLSGGVAALGQDYAWTYDDIGNRRTATTNGSSSNYAANDLNQYVRRTVPRVVDVTGAAESLATVTVAVNGGVPQPASRQNERFHRQVAVDNGTAAQNVQLTINGVRNLAGPNGEDAVASVNQTVMVPASLESFGHDADGNIIDDANWRYTWDGENRLVAMETSAPSAAAGVPRKRLDFAYDGGSRRIAKKVSNWNGVSWTLASHTLFLYDGWNMIAELNALSSNASVRTYVWGADMSGGMQGAGGIGGLLFLGDGSTNATYFPSYDGNGNVVGLFQASDAKLAARYDYTAFGEMTQREGSFVASNPFCFSTKYTDLETGHLYYGYRYYFPAQGRWLNRDPIEEAGGANIYSFVQNAPTCLADPTGLAFFAFDGTNNDGERDAPRSKETNVFILYNISNDPNRRYTPGAGTRDGIFNIFGLAFGAGGRRRVDYMIGEAEKFIKNGDMVFDIVGYSRGAIEARDFANKLKQKYPCVFIRWMGLFDSVASMGLPNNVNIGYALRIHEETGSVLHLVAGAERRARTFALTSIHEGPDKSPSNPRYREVVIPLAVHSDVGGNVGLVGRELANYALHEMWQEGISVGVSLSPIPGKYSDRQMKEKRDSRWATDKIIEAITGDKRVRQILYPK